MADNQTLAAVQEVLLKARIKFTAGTAIQWAGANPVLLKGEVGFIENTYPAQFKVGDGTKKWMELDWGNVTTLAQLTADATHRLVTDTEKAAWNDKAPKNHAAAGTTYGVGTTANYGHVKLADVVDENLGVASGVAATPKAVNIVLEIASGAEETANEARAALANKVDKVTGKGLSANDYTTAEKTKLAGIATGANNYVHPSAHPATIITEDATHRFATDTEKAAWNAKAEKTAATTATAGLMSAADKAKLDGVAAGANNYQHPASHAATMITPDATHRFVTDTEKATWAKKADVFVFDYEAYSTAATAAAQKQIVKDIVAAVAQNRTNIVVVARHIPFPGVEVYLPDSNLNGLVTMTGSGASYVDGLISDFRMIPNDDDTAVTLQTVQITFAADGTVSITPVPYTSELVTKEGLYEYTVEKGTTVSGFAATYYLKKGVERVGVPINIPLDQVLNSAKVKTVSMDNTPYPGAKVGEKYIEFLFQNSSVVQYLPAKDLGADYHGDNMYIRVSNEGIITLQYATLKANLQSDFGSVFDAKGSGAAAAAAAIEEFKSSSFVIQCTIPGM